VKGKFGGDCGKYNQISTKPRKNGTGAVGRVGGAILEVELPGPSEWGVKKKKQGSDKP